MTHQIKDIAGAMEALQTLIDEITGDLALREARLQAEEDLIGKAAESAVALQLEASAEQIAQATREEVARGVAALIDARLSWLDPASGTASTLRYLQADVLETWGGANG